MSARNNDAVNTVWFINVDKVRALVASERELRGVTLLDIEQETGVLRTTISSFLTGRVGLSTSSLVSLIKWSNGKVDQFVERRRNASRHIESPQERELRVLAGYLAAAGFARQDGESVVEAAVRLLAQGKEVGAFGGDI